MTPYEHRDAARSNIKWAREGYHPEKHAALAMMHMMAAEMEEKHGVQDAVRRGGLKK